MIAVIFLKLVIGEALFSVLMFMAAANRAIDYSKGRLKGLGSNLFWIGIACMLGSILAWHAIMQLRPLFQ